MPQLDAEILRRLIIEKGMGLGHDAVIERDHRVECRALSACNPLLGFTAAEVGEMLEAPLQRPLYAVAVARGKRISQAYIHFA